MHVHSVLSDSLTGGVDAALGEAGVRHVAHGDRDPVAAATRAAEDPCAVALVGPLRSADVAEALEATAPAALPLLAPIATWAGVTRDDEPGCDDPARHRGTVLRMVARDTEVAFRVAADVRASGRRALVVAGEHEYGRQLDGQLALAGLPRAASVDDADLVVLCGLAQEPEIARAAELAPLPIVAFDGVQGSELGRGRVVELALPFAPVDGVPHADVLAGVVSARRAAELVATGVLRGAGERAGLLGMLRALGRFDVHGDPVEPPVWLWRAGAGWEVRPERALPAI